MGASLVFCRTFRASVFAGFLSLLTVGLAGCGVTVNLPDVTQSNTLTVPIGELQGSAYGGQQPIWQSHVYLMKASTSGYKTTSTSILTNAANTFADTTVLGTPANPAYYVVTNGFGNFDITGDYSCTYNATTPSQSDQLYLVSLGGNATYLPPMSAPTGGATNAYIGLMSVLGQCPSDGTFAGHISFIYVNEVSTVAAAYSLAAFAGNSHSVGTNSTAQAQVGMANAFANSNQLYDITGSAPGHEARQVTPNGTGAIGGVVPYKLIDTLANIMANCINQGLTAAVPTSGACQTLYTLTGNAPDAASAMIYIAQHPNQNVTALFNLQPTNVEFPDKLANKPNDFVVGINYVGTSTANPIDVAIDGTGDAWVTSGNGYILKLNPTGLLASGSPINLPNVNYISIDPSGNAWVTANNLIYEMDNTGANMSGSPYTSSQFGNNMAAIVTDSTGVYFANPNAGLNLLGVNTPGEVIQLKNPGLSPSYGIYYNGVTNILTGATLNNIPTVSQIANGAPGSLWVSGDALNCVLGVGLFCAGLQTQKVNQTTDFPSSLIFSAPMWTTSSFVSSSSTVSYSCYLNIGPCSAVEVPGAVAVDSAGTGWVAVAGGSGGVDELAHVSSSGSVSALLTGGGLSSPQGVAIDGAGNVFIANAGNASLSEYASTAFLTGVSASSGLTGASNGSTPGTLLNTPTNLDIDESGNVWIVNAAGSSGYVTEFIGLATPVVRPLSSGKLGVAP